jgi:hypothetical protein
MKLVTGPFDKGARRLRREPAPRTIGADPVMKLGGVSGLVVQADDAECEVRALFDHCEVVEAIFAPGLLVASRQFEAARQRWLARPRHPRQQLGPGIDNRSVEPFGMHRFDRLEPKPPCLERYSARGGGADALAPSRAGPTQTVWMLVNSLIPYSESSRP